MDELQKDVFSRFANQYDAYRPESPVEMLHSIISRYLESDLTTIADVGCGTGLSTLPWAKYANKVIGIERNKEMLEIAKNKMIGNPIRNVTFMAGESEQIPLGDGQVDLVTCSQSFHWMAPQETLTEFARILKPNGIVAIYDCDWPPSIGERLETISESVIASAKDTLKRCEIEIKPWPKSQHLQNMRDSGLFKFVKEICFHEITKMSAEHFIGIIESRAWLQHALKTGDKQIVELFEQEKVNIQQEMGNISKTAIMSYRVRIALK